MNIHFIGGLPRSGSTLLSAILSQNKNISAGMSTPIYDIFMSTLNCMGSGSTHSVFLDEKKRIEILRGIVKGYYSDVGDNRIITDTNRGWQSCLPAVITLFPSCRFIFMVRDLVEVYSSFERLYRNNPFSAAFSTQNQQAYIRQTVYDRIQLLSSSDGAVGFAYRGLREACFSEHLNKALIVEYSALINDPKTTIEKIYEYLGILYFSHDFDNIKFSGGDEFDKRIGLAGMHKVFPTIKPNSHMPILPPDLSQQFSGLEFWREKLPNLAHLQIIR